MTLVELKFARKLHRRNFVCVCVCLFVCLFCFPTCVNLQGLQCKTEHFTRNRSCLRPGYIRSRVRKTTYCSLLITKLLYILSRYLQTLVSYTVKQNLFHSLDIAFMSALDKTRSLTSEKSAVYWYCTTLHIMTSSSEWLTQSVFATRQHRSRKLKVLKPSSPSSLHHHNQRCPPRTSACTPLELFEVLVQGTVQVLLDLI